MGEKKWRSHEANLQKYLGVFGVGHDVQEVLGQDVEGVGVIKAEDQDGGLRVLVVTRSYTAAIDDRS